MQSLSVSAQAFRLIDTAPAGAPGPLVFASPHSGRVYPPDLIARARLPVAALRAGEDRFVDALVAGVGARGVPCLLAETARAYVDLNRHPDELDPELIVPLPPGTRATDRVAAGLGVIPRAFAKGQAIYAERLTLAAARARIAAVHAPYHAELARLLARARARNGYALLVDVHSMPTPPGGARAVVGDLNGRAADAAVVDAVADGLAAIGLLAARNIPYAGAYTLERHGQPHAGVHAVQIEIDRALYLDADGTRLLAAAAQWAERIAAFAGALARTLDAMHAVRTLAVAAE